MDITFWKNKRILITGNNGFKGSWLTKWLDMMGAYTCGISLEEDFGSVYSEIKFSDKNISHIQDLRNYSAVNKIVEDFQPEIVIHLAAQAIVKVAAEKPADTFSTNIMGTVNLLDILKNYNEIKAILVITSDKVYENKEKSIFFDEESVLFGDEPYSASKVCQELVVNAYRETYFKTQNVGIATARAANTFGAGDNHFDRLLPYLIKSVYDGMPINLRNPDAVRPWQYILDLIRGYLTLTQRVFENPHKYSQGYNFGPNINELYTVAQIAECITSKNINITGKSFKEADVLMLNSEKSKNELGWEPIYTVPEGIVHTCGMYNSYFNGLDYNELIENEIKNYQNYMEVVYGTKR